MKKLICLIVVIGALALIVAGCGLLTVPPSEQNELSSVANKTVANEEVYTDGVPKDAHKIRNKWNLTGDFVAHSGYNWGGGAEGATWVYSIHIKEAMSGEFSVGSIHFMTGDIDVVGQVKQTARSYNWGDIAAAGTAEYNDTTFYFLFLYAERAIWFALSTTPYDSYWTTGNIWGESLRAYQLHSKVPEETFLIDYKEIHE